MQDLEQAIRERAYQFWSEGGHQEGHAESHWLAAQREVLGASLGELGRVNGSDTTCRQTEGEDSKEASRVSPMARPAVSYRPIRMLRDQVLQPTRPKAEADLLYTQSPSAKVCRPSWIPNWR